MEKVVIFLLPDKEVVIENGLNIKNTDQAISPITLYNMYKVSLINIRLVGNIEIFAVLETGTKSNNCSRDKFGNRQKLNVLKNKFHSSRLRGMTV